jgi:hypothetical protein
MVRPVIALACSIAALALGPALLALGRGGRALAAAVDAFVVVVVVGVVFLHYVPHALHEAGPGVLFGMLLGLSIPYWAERAHRGTGGWVKAVALFAFALHAVLDGAALYGSALHGGQWAFVLALVVHRVAEGLAIEHMARGSGPRGVAAAILLVMVATLVGYGLGERVALLGESWPFLFLQALTSGALLHVVLHGHAGHGGAARPEALGAVAGMLVMTLVSLLDPEVTEVMQELSMGTTLLALGLHVAPALVLGTTLTLLLDRWGGARLVGRKLATRGEALWMGLVLPPCVCGEGQLSDAPPSRAALVSALAHPAVVLVSAVLLGPGFALARGLSGLLGAQVLQASPGVPQPAHCGAGDARALSAAFDRALRSSLGFLLVGLCASAWLEPVLGPDAFAGIPPWFALSAAAVLGLPLHACAVGVTPVLVLLAHKGLAPGAVLAFSLSSGMLRVSTRGAALRRHALQGVLVSAACGAVFQVLGGGVGGLLLHRHAAQAVEPLEALCLALCVVVLMQRLVRRGPRALFAPLWPEAHVH